MTPADTIGRVGFRKWYERQLIESHAWLVTCLLCMLMVAAILEVIDFRGPGARAVLLVATVIAAGMLGIHGWRRYRALLVDAERYADRASCERCESYGRFRVVPPATARCRRCGNEWRFVPEP